MREDTFTHTEADAAEYERYRAEAAGEFDDDRPTLSDLEEPTFPSTADMLRCRKGCGGALWTYTSRLRHEAGCSGVSPWGEVRP